VAERQTSVKRLWLVMAALLMLAACDEISPGSNSGNGGNGGGGSSGGTGETGVVTRVIDGDTIDVNINGQVTRIRYVGVNTPESDEACYTEATNANKGYVEGKTVTLVRDSSNTDRYDRLLRFVYVGNVFVNAELVKAGYAEAVLYEPDDGHHDEFVEYERQSQRAGRGCHPTGIFNDNSSTR
jgi:endonuclease YncB( thermonuclease family)